VDRNDHVVPKSAGGTNELDNLALTCPHCNAHKWTEFSGRNPKTRKSGGASPN
jgi:5-methylcytosine-specific restriction endonuclease McrA